MVVFDLDGTLVAGDSFGAFLRHLMQRRSLRRIAAVATAPAWLPALFLPPTRLFAEQYLVWLAAVGMDEETFAAAAHWLPSSPRTPSPRSVAR
jgi:phosphatidylglycerophosphatase C